MILLLLLFFFSLFPAFFFLITKRNYAAIVLQERVLRRIHARVAAAVRIQRWYRAISAQRAAWMEGMKFSVDCITDSFFLRSTYSNFFPCNMNSFDLNTLFSLYMFALCLSRSRICRYRYSEGLAISSDGRTTLERRNGRDCSGFVARCSCFSFESIRFYLRSRESCRIRR